MIRISKGREPQGWKSDQIREYEASLFNFYNSSDSDRRQRKAPVYDKNIFSVELREELLKKSKKKCAYCESRLESTNVSIDHFRPQANAAGVDGKISKIHYWWLSMEWSNLLPSCKECNTRKRNFFPTINNRSKINYTDKSRLFKVEKPVLIDPEFENPERHFYYDLDSCKIFPYNERAEETIGILGLNREGLVASREKVRNTIEPIISRLFSEIEHSNSTNNEYLNIISDFFNWYEDSEIEYLGFRRNYFRQFYRENSNLLSKYLSAEQKRKLKITPFDDRKIGDWMDRKKSGTNRFEINTIKIKNYNSIKELTLRYKRTKEGNAGWIVLIGENGTGKSSALRATLKTLVGRSFRNFRFLPSEIKRGENDGAFVEITFNDLDQQAFITILERASYALPKNYFINSSIIAFGPFKHSNPKDTRAKDFIEGSYIYNFVDPSIPLHYPLNFLLRLNHRQFDEVATGLLNLLLLENKARIHRNFKTKDVWIQYDEATNTRTKFNELSDGYKSIITLACNIMEGLLRNNENIENAQGLVVIDEIGANLHPRWKMQIVSRLRRTFPNVQFLVTTHDPLCLKGIQEGETYVLTNVDFKTEVLSELPNPSNLRPDQLLTSEFFGLYSTQDAETENLFESYYRLLSLVESNRPPDYDLELELLKNELRKRNHLGNSLREELYYDIVDTAIAKRQNEVSFGRAKIKSEVKEEALKLINKILDDLE